MPLRAAEWLLIHVGLTLGMGLLFLLLFGGALVPALIGVALGLPRPVALPLLQGVAPHSTRSSAQLPDTLQLLAGSLSAGYSLPQAMDTVVREGQPPMSRRVQPGAGRGPTRRPDRGRAGRRRATG